MVSADRAPYAPHAGGELRALPALVDGLARIAQWLRRARARSVQRQRLAELPDYRLRDVGITCEQALHESSKPFWCA